MTVNIVSLTKRKFTLLIVILTLIGCLTHFGVEFWDSCLYYNASLWILGEVPKELVAQALFRPLTPLLATIPHVAGLSLQNSYALINTLISISIAIVMYEFSKQLLGDDQLAFYAAIFLVSNYTFLWLCAGVNVDVASWFFILAGLYSARKHYPHNKHPITGLIIAIGIFAKESTFAVLLYLFLYETLHRRWKRLVITTLIAVFPISAWLALHQLSYLSWYVGTWTGYGLGLKKVELVPNPYSIVKTLIWTFLPAMMFLPFGFLAEQDKDKIRFYYLSFISIFSVIMAWMWGAYRKRLYILTFPPILPLCALGVRSFCQQLCEKPIFNRLNPVWLEWIVIIMSIVLGYYFEYATYKEFRLVGL
jgi:hypothetical protein